MPIVFLNEIPRNPWVAMAVPVGLGFASGSITRSQIKSWYEPLKKPKYTPPRYAIPIAWTYLYCTMGYASHLIAKVLHDPFASPIQHANAQNALNLYWSSFAINMVWTPLFFGAHRTDLALIDIAALFANVVALTVTSFKVDEVAGWLYVPYIAWVGFASYLNYGVWDLNFRKKGKGSDGPQPPSVPKQE